MKRARAAALGASITLLGACPPGETGLDPDADPSDGGPRPDAPRPSADALGACEHPSQPGCDCDPSGSLPAYPVFEDSLVADEGQAEPAPGFDAGAWFFEADAYRQEGELAPGRRDASLFETPEEGPEDLLLEITAASTTVENFEDDARQIFATARTSADESSYEAVGCGIELSQNGDTERTVSAVELAGAPGDVSVERRETREYGGVDLGEEFAIRMELRGDEMRCRVLAGGEATFVKADGFGGGGAGIGVYTRENHASFRNARACGLP